MGHLVIKHSRPYQIAVIAISVSLVLFVSAWFFLDESHWNYITSRVPAGLQTKKLWDENRRLEQENRNLLNRIVMLERTTQIDGQAAAELHQQMKKLQDEIFRLRGELEFYENAMTTAGETKGLSIQALQFQKLNIEQDYHFKLILTHVTKSDKVAEGTVEMILEGIQDGEVKSVNINELLTSSLADLNFKFKNFKRLEGSFRIPDGFTPRQVVVSLVSADKNLSKIVKIFDWSGLTG